LEIGAVHAKMVVADRRAPAVSFLAGHDEVVEHNDPARPVGKKPVTSVTR